MQLVNAIRLALQELTTPEQQLNLHYFTHAPGSVIWEQPAEQLLEGFVAVGEAIAPALESIMVQHFVVKGVEPLIIVGDSILLSIVAQPCFHELKHFNGLRIASEV